MKKKMQGKSQDKVELLQTRSELDENFNSIRNWANQENFVQGTMIFTSKTWNIANLIMPLSLELGRGSNRESIISSLGDCVRTVALYWEIDGQCLELTT